MLKILSLILLFLITDQSVALADYRNSYDTPYGNTYESRFGSQYRQWYQNKMNAMPYSNQYPPHIQNVPAYSHNEPVESQEEKPRVEESGSISLSDGKKPIVMEISHSEYLPSLPPSLRPGASFTGWSNNALPVSESYKGMIRFIIPNWLAGQWKRTESKETKRVKLPEGTELKTAGTTAANVIDTFGTYLDGDGRIWQVFDPKRASGQVDRGDFIDHHRVMKYKIEILGPDSVMVEVVASHLVVNKQKNQIVKSFQDEELNTYTLLKNGNAKTESSVKVFDQLGKPVLLTHAVSYVSKIQGKDSLQN